MKLDSLPMRAGRLRFVVTIEQPEYTTDNTGGYTSTYTTLYTLRADIQTLSPSATPNLQQFIQYQERYTQHFVVTIRTQPNISNNYRVNYDGRYLYIYSIVDFDVRQRMTQLYCREGG